MNVFLWQVMESLSQRQAQQALANEYRSSLADTQSLLEALARRLDGVEPGSGMDCQNKLTVLAQVRDLDPLTSDFYQIFTLNVIFVSLSRSMCRIRISVRHKLLRNFTVV